MKVVIDTNVLLISLPKSSKYRPIFDALLLGKIDLAVSTEILNEYVEIIGRKTNPAIANNLAELLTKLDNVHKTEVYYRWNLIKQDPDDNKFVDCALSAGALFIATNDHHFKELENVNFPKMEVVSADGFLNKLTQ